MSITISPEVEAMVRQIPNFAARLERFINDQFELELWRIRRSKSDVVAIVEEGLRDGTALRATDANRDELFARMRSLMESLPHGYPIR